MLRALARDLVPLRPGRTEPHAIKYRPKPFPLLNRCAGILSNCLIATTAGMAAHANIKGLN